MKILIPTEVPDGKMCAKRETSSFSKCENYYLNRHKGFFHNWCSGWDKEIYHDEKCAECLIAVISDGGPVGMK